jgi:hypothetical protein
MLKLYYSGGNGRADSTSYAAKSLGQYVSATEITDGLNNLFADLASLTLQNKKTEYRAIVLTNESEDEVLTNLSAWLIDETGANSDALDDSLCEFQIGWVDLAAENECALPKFPYSIANIYQSPLKVTFYSAYNQENALDMPNLEPGMSLGLWIKRIIKDSALIPPSDEVLCEITDGSVSLPTTESVQLIFDWTESDASV